MKNKIDFLRIEIKPSRYSCSYSDHLRELRVELQVNGQRFGYQKLAPEDEIRSFFDQCFDEARESLRKALADPQHAEYTK